MAQTRDELLFLTDCSKRDFEVLKKWTNLAQMSEQEAMDNLIGLIAYKISKMMEYQHKQLLDLLYATDIDERKVRACFHPEKSTSEVANDLALLYIDRMRQKWKTRLDYRNQNIEGDWD